MPLDTIPNEVIFKQKLPSRVRDIAEVRVYRDTGIEKAVRIFTKKSAPILKEHKQRLSFVSKSDRKKFKLRQAEAKRRRAIEAGKR